MSVVLITVDTLRWDRIGVNDRNYGPSGRDTMPHLNEWAKHAVNFKTAYSPGGWTTVAVGSLMRGVYARRLAYTNYYETNRYRLLRTLDPTKLETGERFAKMFPIPWRDPHKPLPWWLRRRGMKTVAVVDDGFSQMLSRDLQAGMGFQLYREMNDMRPILMRRGGKTYARSRKDDRYTASTAINSLDYREDSRPFFLWVHFFGPHTPNTRHAGLRHDGNTVPDKYDHELRYADQQLNRLLEKIEPYADRTAVFVTSDHGEAVWNSYRSHGMDLREAIVKVPLFARVPGWKAQTVTEAVSLIDLMPTIMALTRTEAPTYLDGVDLAPLVRGEKISPRVLFSDTWQFRRDGECFTDRVAAFDGKRKVVLNRLDHSFSAFDQTRPDSQPMRLEGWAADDLVRSIMGYVEDTGGTLKKAL